MAYDPICKMQVDEASSVHRSFMRGQPYYFCSADCKSKFDQNPERYVAGQGETGGRSEGDRPKMEQQKEDLKAKAQDLKQELKEKTMSRSKSTIESQKGKAAAGLESMARALRKTSETFQGENQRGISQYAKQLAGKMEGASHYVRDKNIDELIDDAGKFVQRQPVLALSGIFTMGFIVARFLKSSSAGGVESEAQRSYDI